MTAASTWMLAQSFRYDDETRRKIADLLQPFMASSVEAVRSGREASEIAIESIEAAGRSAIRGYGDSVSADQRRRHYRHVSGAARKLLRLIKSGELGGGSAGYFISDFGRTDQTPAGYSFLPIFTGALAELAAKSEELASCKKPPYPGYEDLYPGVHDPEKVEFAERILMIFAIEANQKPGRSATGPAARLLLATVDPLMKFARSIGIEKATPILEGHNAKTIIELILDRVPIGENLPVL